jgi:DNA-binding MarR family transcriptional regulator
MGPSDRPEGSTLSLLFDVYAASQAVGSLLDAAMAGDGLRPGQYAVYSAVFESERISPTVLAHRLGVPLTTAIDHVRAMERRGHARRHPNPADGRSFLVALTAQGLAAHRAASLRFEVADARFRAQLRIDPTEARAALLAVADAAWRAAGLEAEPSSGRSQPAVAEVTRPAGRSVRRVTRDGVERDSTS